MIKITSLPLLLLICISGSAQDKIAEGVNLLFKQVKTKLSTTEKNAIYKMTAFSLSKTKNNLLPLKKPPNIHLMLLYILPT